MQDRRNVVTARAISLLRRSVADSGGDCSGDGAVALLFWGPDSSMRIRGNFGYVAEWDLRNRHFLRDGLAAAETGVNT